MRICLYTETALPMLGGQELVVDGLVRQFVELGHHPVVVAPPPRGSWWARDRSLPYQVVRQPKFVSTRWFLDAYAWLLGRVQRRYQFDVVHCHSVYPTGYVAARSAAIARLPLVITSHGGDVCPTSRLLKKPSLPARFAYALQHADALVAISQFTAARFGELCSQPARIVAIPNGIDVTGLRAPAPRPPELDKAIRPGEYFLFLGRVVARKGIGLLLDAWTERQIPHHLVVAGDGPDLTAFREQAATRGLGDRVTFVGRAEGALKIYLLQNTVATVVPSRISEGLPVVVLESYAAGRPVIATRVPGLEEIVEDNRTGLLVPADSPAALSEALLWATENRARLAEMGQAAQQRADRYDWPTVAAEHLALYEELIARKTLRANSEPDGKHGGSA